MLKTLHKFRLLMIALLVGLSGTASAQTNIANYAFAVSTGTYTPIVGTTFISGTYDNNVSAAISLGGTFTFGGAAFTTCYISANGFITFGAAPAGTNYTPISALGSTTGAISAFGQDAGSSTVTGSSPRISYTNVGSEFVVQYADHANYYNSSVERLNFQIRLNLTTNAINIVYGSFTNPGTSTSGINAQVGIRGNTVAWATNVNALQIANIPTGTTCDWSNAVTANANSSTMLFSGANTAIKPTTGLTYTWTPQTTPAPVQTFAAVSAITSTTATIGWTAPTGATQYNVRYRVVGTCGWTNFSGNPVATTSATLTGLLPSSVYQIQVQASNGTNNAIWSHIPTSAAGTGLNGYTTSGTFTTLAAACSGTPGTAVASGPAAACAGQSFALTATGLPTTTGITYQWQSSPAGANTFTNITGATTVPYTIASQTAATDYRLVITCTSSTLTSNSNTVSVTQNTFLTCYCTPASTCTNEYIKTISLNGFTSSNTTCNTGGYFNGASAGSVTTLLQGTTYAIAVLAHINDVNSQAGVWIDYDQSGTFDASEFTLIGTLTGSNVDQTFTNSILVPGTALTGTTRIRVRTSNGGGVSAASACTATGVYGEYEDYLVTIATGTPCSGTPTAGTASSTVTTTCPAAAFTLSSTGYTSGVTGITYQWQSSPAGAGTFTNIAGATGPTYTVAAQSTSTDYQFVVTCTNSTQSATSNIVSVTTSAFMTCYCTPATTNSTYYISSFSTTGALTNISNPNTTYSTGGYGNYTSQTLVTYPGQVVSFSTAVSAGASYGETIFIDYNHNGVFTDAGEAVFTTTGYLYSPITGTFTIPMTALSGTTRMRVVANEAASNPSSQYCTGVTYGEYEDYSVNIYPLVPCTGTPAVAVASSSVPAACPTLSFTLNATNLPTPGTTGITYQWQSSPAGAGTFTNITGATTVPYTISSQTVATDYQLLITCANSTQTSTSNVVSVAVGGYSTCYCIPTGGNCSSEWVNGVTFNTLSNPSTGCSGSGYADYRLNGALTTSVNQGATYTITLDDHINAASSQIGVWIDYNHSGTFDAGEFTLVGTGPATGFSSLSQSFTASITIPLTAMTGVTGMRVYAKNGTIANTGACASAFFGEVEDYIITINPQVPCSGTPATVTASSSVSTACPSVSFTLSATNLPNTTGITYQWQSSPAGAGTFTNISGATNASYVVTGQTASTDFQLLVTCTNSGQSSTSNIVTVATTSFLGCYCTPSATNATYYITGFSTTGATGTNISNTPTGYSTNGYQDYSATMGASSLPGSTVNFTYGLSTTGGFGFAIYIDYNHNGSFADAGEVAYNTTAYNFALTGSGTFTVPATALTGVTKMRIVANYNNSIPTTDYCLTGISGEFEDYAFTVIVPPACVAPAAPATGLALTTPSTTSVSGSFTAAAPAASGYLVLQTPNASMPSAIPVDGTAYTIGATLGNATVVGVGAGLTFTSTGLTSNTQYTYTVYDYNNTICTGGPIYNINTPTNASIATPILATYTGTGIWSDAGKWSTNQVPNDCNTQVAIAANSAVTVDGSYQAGAVTTNAATSAVIVPTGTVLSICTGLTNNGAVTISGGSVTVGTNGLYNNTASNASGANMTVSSGALSINGNLSVASGATFAQSGGAITVDGNGGGNAAISVAANTPIVNFASSNLTFSGGTFTIVDPHASATLTSALDYNTTGNVEASANHTFIFGDGVSTDPGGVANSNRIRVNVGTGRLNLGSVIVNGGTGANRYAFLGTGSLGVNGSLTINNGGEFRMNSALYLNGNLTVNTGGTLTTVTNAVNFSSFTAGTAGGATAAQTVTNNGTIQNAITGATANFYSFVFRNSNGITFNSDVSYSSGLTFTAGTSGPSIVTMANNSKLIQIAGATQSGSATTGWINGRFQKAAATGGINNIFVVGDATTYAPVTVGNATGGTVLTAGNITASTKPGDYLVTSTGGLRPRIDSSKINQDKSVNRYWTIEEGGGITFSTAGIKVIPTWVGSDTDVAARTANFIVGRYIPSMWIYPTVSNPTTTSIEALNNNNGTSNTIAGDYIVGEVAAKPNLTVALQGDVITTGANTGTMRNDLQNYLNVFGIALLPTTNPYGLPGTYPTINNPAGPAGTVVDWVRVDVTAAATPNTATESRALLLKPNGNIVDTRGLAPAFAVRTAATRIVVRHRNSLAVLTNSLPAFNDFLPYNFTTALSQASSIAGDPAQMVLTGGKWAMWSGDVNQDLGIDGTDKGQVQSASDAGAFDVYDVNDLSLDGGLDGTDAGIINYSSSVAPYSTLLNY